MSFRRGMRVVCVWDAATIEREAANFARAYGVPAAALAPGAVYRIEDLTELSGFLWLRLAGMPPHHVHRADGFRPAVEGDAEIERLRAVISDAVISDQTLVTDNCSLVTAPKEPPP